MQVSPNCYSYKPRSPWFHWLSRSPTSTGPSGFLASTPQRTKRVISPAVIPGPIYADRQQVSGHHRVVLAGNRKQAGKRLWDRSL